LRWHALDLDAAEVTFGGSTAVIRGQRVEGCQPVRPAILTLDPHPPGRRPARRMPIR